MNVYRSRTFIADIAVTLSGVAYDLTGAALYFTVKESPLASDSMAKIATDSGENGGISINEPATEGTCVLTLEASAMQRLAANKTYYWEITVVDEGCETFTAATGTWVMNPVVKHDLV